MCHAVITSNREHGNASPLAESELEISSKQDIIEVAQALEQVALEDDYFKQRKLFPNVDFFSGIVLQEIGFPRDMFTVMFALARSIGWICHWREMMSEPIIKIGRPRQLYVGEKTREYVEIEDREETDQFEDYMGKPVFKAHSLR